jgi:hypothetical protein
MGLYLLVLLASPALAGGSGDAFPANREVILRPHFEVTVRGVVNSTIKVRFQVTPNKKFLVSRNFLNGESVELRGVLRMAKQQGDYVLDLTIAETQGKGRRVNTSFTVSLAERKKQLLCHGWSSWYEANLTRLK